MAAVDTNVLIRLIVGDNAEQTASAEEFVEGSAWVSLIALAETMWVLKASYAFSAAQLSGAIEMLLNHATLTLQDAEVVTAALEQYRLRPALGFSDCLIVEQARKAGHLPLGTFDRALGRVNGAQKL
jgi:predicted nucleic-acid-binding protein